MAQSWDGWQHFRDAFRAAGPQRYTSVGIQHVFLPTSFRYHSDRSLGVNIGVPSVNAILRISSSELLPSLAKVFPIDTYQITGTFATIRSYFNHAAGAYSGPLVDHVSTLNRLRSSDTVTKEINDLRERSLKDQNGLSSTSPIELQFDKEGNESLKNLNGESFAVDTLLDMMIDLTKRSIMPC